MLQTVMTFTVNRLYNSATIPSHLGLLPVTEASRPNQPLPLYLHVGNCLQVNV